MEDQVENVRSSIVKETWFRGTTKYKKLIELLCTGRGKRRGKRKEEKPK